ncbi:CAP domain-containing protein [Priestia megaterium]
MAGENIASNYQDGIAAVEGWLNSEGHRKALLNKEFTRLGVGVYEKYYTQNFITPMNE